MQNKRSLEIIRRLAQRLQDEAPEMPGAAVEYDGGIADGGGYGDPHTDDTPDWIKQDLDGWTKSGGHGSG
jgi:hypothetical protein